MAGQARLAGSATDSASNSVMNSVACPWQQPPRGTLRYGNELGLRMTDLVEPAAELACQLLGLLESALHAGDGDVPHRGQADELRVPHLFRQRLHVVRGRHGGGVLSVLELRGQPDPQPLELQL